MFQIGTNCCVKMQKFTGMILRKSVIYLNMQVTILVIDQKLDKSVLDLLKLAKLAVHCTI